MSAAAHLLSEEEIDQFDRSTKKKKAGDHTFSSDSSGPVCYDDLYEREEEAVPVRRTYKETMLGVPDEGTNNEGTKKTGGTTDNGEPHLGGMNLQIVEKKVGGYDCPEIVIPSHAEVRLCRPWKQGLIVKLLGRHIGFKALENRLNQLWVQKGVMTLVDLGSEFFLVYLTSPADYDHVLNNGPWMIYDHYLTIRPWRPNFRPEEEEIEHVTCWVRLPELPIEYYDADFLDFLGNRIGRTVKVDKTTASHSRGKFARLCVEIDLNKSLLAMFEIQGHVYRIEYEGLHLLCLACGKFGHHKDQCVDTEKTVASSEVAPVEPADATRDATATKTRAEGPWTVVQKQRWPRKPKDKSGPGASGGGRVLPATLNGNSMKGGSRYDILGTTEEDTECNNEERDMHVENISEQIIVENGGAHKKQGVNATLNQPSQPRNRRANHAVMNVTSNDLEKDPRANPQPTRAPPVSKSGTSVRPPPSITHQVRGSPSDHQVLPHAGDHMDTNEFPALKSSTGPNKEAVLDNPNSHIRPGPTQFHSSRPPDIGTDVISHTPHLSIGVADVGMMDSEEFVDANEQGESIASDSDMEVVVETAPTLN